MVLFNETGIMYTVVNGITAHVTGDIFLTLLLIIAGFILFAFAFRMPLEYTMIFVFPILIAAGAEGGAGFMPVLAAGIIYMSVLLIKNFFFWK